MTKISAYADGVKDAKAGRERKNASDFWGPYNDDYHEGFDAVMRKKTIDLMKKESKPKNLDHLSAFFDFGLKK